MATFLCGLTGKKANDFIEEKEEASPGIKLYPNPANSAFNLEYLFTTGKIQRGSNYT